MRIKAADQSKGTGNLGMALARLWDDLEDARSVLIADDHARCLAGDLPTRGQLLIAQDLPNQYLACVAQANLSAVMQDLGELEHVQPVGAAVK
jgi:hypothetical protein